MFELSLRRVLQEACEAAAGAAASHWSGVFVPSYWSNTSIQANKQTQGTFHPEVKNIN